jgi:hypothetical protein
MAPAERERKSVDNVSNYRDNYLANATITISLGKKTVLENLA